MTKSSWVWASLPYRVSFRVTLNSNVPIIDIMTSKLFDQKRRTTGTIINFLDRILVRKKKYWNRLLRKSEQIELELHAISPLRITKIIKYKVMTQFHSAIGPISMFVLLSLSFSLISDGSIWVIDKYLHLILRHLLSGRCRWLLLWGDQLLR